MSDDMKEATNKQKRESEAKQRAAMSDDMKEATNKQKRERRAARSAASKLSDEASRVNFSNLTEEVLSAVAMEPGDGVKLHFKNHIDCPEANACLNHLSTHRNHFIDDPTTVQGRERLKQKIRGQYISPEKQKEVAERFLASQGRGCEWSSLEKKNNFVESKSRDAPIYTCACCGNCALDAFDDVQLTFETVSIAELKLLKLSPEEKNTHVTRMQEMRVEDCPCDEF